MFLKKTLSIYQQNIFSQKRNISLLSRLWSDQQTKHSEEDLSNILKQKFPEANQIVVNDISGGCGAMYEIMVQSISFKGISRVKQHQMITSALKEQIKDMHGLRIHTELPSDD